MGARSRDWRRRGGARGDGVDRRIINHNRVVWTRWCADAFVRFVRASVRSCERSFVRSCERRRRRTRRRAARATDSDSLVAVWIVFVEGVHRSFVHVRQRARGFIGFVSASARARTRRAVSVSPPRVGLGRRRRRALGRGRRARGCPAHRLVFFVRFQQHGGREFSFSRGGRCARGRRRRQSIRASSSVGRSPRRRVSANPDDIGSIGARERRRDARDARLGARIEAKKKHPSTHPSERGRIPRVEPRARGVSTTRGTVPFSGRRDRRSRGWICLKHTTVR